MRRYEQVSGAFFCLFAVVQLTRVILHWPVQVADVPVPLWARSWPLSSHPCSRSGPFAPLKCATYQAREAAGAATSR
jgi:hypothetical protein